MSDWQVGDLAVCVNSPGYRIVVGNVYRVTRVGRTSITNTLALGLDGSGEVQWYADRFRKIRPDAHEGNVEDWNLILETTKRKVRA